MKTIIRFFVMIYKWFLSLFKRKVNTVAMPIVYPYPNQSSWTNRPQKRTHNNRKNTKGRFVQYINVGENRQRAIYHSCK